MISYCQPKILPNPFYRTAYHLGWSYQVYQEGSKVSKHEVISDAKESRNISGRYGGRSMGKLKSSSVEVIWNKEWQCDKKRT